MLSLKELQRRVDAYKDARTSHVEFRDWFEANSYDAYEDEVLRPICVAIDTAFSEYLFDNIGEDVLKQELAKAVHPLASEFSDIEILFLPDPALARIPAWDVPYNLYLDYPDQQYPLFPRAEIPLPWVSPYGTSTVVPEAALPSQRVDWAASASRVVELEAVGA
jgi:hypothetical protein